MERGAAIGWTAALQSLQLAGQSLQLAAIGWTAALQSLQLAGQSLQLAAISWTAALRSQGSRAKYMTRASYLTCSPRICTFTGWL